MGVDLAIISMLDSEADVDTSALEHVIVEADIPRCHLEDVEQVAGDVLIWHTLVHDVSKGTHRELSSPLVARRETFCFQYTFI